MENEENEKVGESVDVKEFFPRDATAEEIQTLIHEIEPIPITAWLLAFTGASTQLARFGVTVAWREYYHSRSLLLAN